MTFSKARTRALFATPNHTAQLRWSRPIDTAAQSIRFGDFEFDPITGELRRQNRTVRLTGQSLQVLNALLERPGELVTRDDLRKRLWPEDTFVDFEHGLNAAVRRLRRALGDSARKPRFIDTLPRRGYRFLPAIQGAGAWPTLSATAHRPALDFWRRLLAFARLDPIHRE